jgi:hypothetical protein
VWILTLVDKFCRDAVEVDIVMCCDERKLVV